MTRPWRQLLLGDVVNLKRGYDLPKRLRKTGNAPIVSSSGISGTHNEAKVRGPGVVTGRYGTLGEVFYIEGDYWPLNTTLYVQDFKGNHRRFISYFLQTLGFASQNTAGAVPGVNRNHLHKLEVCVPSVSAQRKIAAILSGYDDLIENNTRRIAILEEMAQAIYREWFVNFRFPGHENVKLVDSPLGQIPEGWDLSRLGDVISATRGLSYKGKHLNPDGIPMHNLNSVLEGGGYKYAGIKFYDGPYKPKHVVKPGDLVVANTEQGFERRLIGFAALIPRTYTGDGIASHHLYIVKPLETTYLTPIFFLQKLNNEHFQWGLSGFANGTTINMLPADALAFPQFPMPPRSLVKDFTETAEQILEQKEVLYRKNNNLRQTRDLLLPKLISGKLDVEDLDIDVSGREEERKTRRRKFATG